MRRSLSCLLAAVLLCLPAPAEAASRGDSDSWAGAGDFGSGLGHVHARLVAPRVSARCGSSAQVAAWIGLEGGAFTQMGLTFTPSGDGAWYEVFDSTGAGFERDVTFTYSAGQHVGLSLWWNPSRSRVWFRWVNRTTGHGVTVTVRHAHRYYAGAEALWMVERHPTLPPFGTVAFRDARYGRYGARRWLEPASSLVDMWHDGHYLAQTDGAAVTWQACS